MIKILIKLLKRSLNCIFGVPSNMLARICRRPFLFCLALCYGWEDEDVLMEEQAILIEMGHEDPYPGTGCNRLYRKCIGCCCSICLYSEKEIAYFYGLPPHYKRAYLQDRSWQEPDPLTAVIVDQPVSMSLPSTSQI